MKLSMSTSLPPDPYKVLGVNKDATLAEIRLARRKLILKCHPDKFQGPAIKVEKQKEFEAVQRAYELLSDDGKRSQYDDQEELVRLRKDMGRAIPRKYLPSRVNSPSDQYESDESERHRLSLAQDVSSSNTRRRSHSSRKSPEGMLVTKGHINGVMTHAIPDTGAEFNMVAADFVKRLGLQIQDQDPSQCRLLRMANGKHVNTVGIVHATWTFTSSSLQSWEIMLHVLADFVYDVILGSGFLFATQTMSRHKERLSRIPRPIGSLSVLRVNLLGSATHYVNGYLGKQAVRALPDSGSEPSIVSYAYARCRGWIKKMDIFDQHLLQFADGSLGKTEGSISASWLFPEETFPNLRVIFHVLRGCPHNVILGQDALEQSDAFSKHENAFSEVASGTETSGLNLVIWLSKKKKKGQSTPASEPTPTASLADQSSRLRVDELQQRAIMDRRTRRMEATMFEPTTVKVESKNRLVNMTSLRGSSASATESARASSSSDLSRQSSRQLSSHPQNSPSRAIPTPLARRQPQRTNSIHSSDDFFKWLSHRN